MPQLPRPSAAMVSVICGQRREAGPSRSLPMAAAFSGSGASDMNAPAGRRGPQSEARRPPYTAAVESAAPEGTRRAICARTGGTAPCVMSAANETAVHLFLQHRLGYNRIYDAAAGAVEKLGALPCPDLDAVLAADEAARAYVKDNF